MSYNVNNELLIDPDLLYASCMPKDSVHELGWSLLESLYPEAVDIAKSITGVENKTQAVKLFRQYIHSPSMYFNEEPFPKNESDETAHRKCNSERGTSYTLLTPPFKGALSRGICNQIRMQIGPICAVQIYLVGAKIQRLTYMT